MYHHIFLTANNIIIYSTTIKASVGWEKNKALCVKSYYYM